MKFWVAGGLVPAEQAAVAVLDHGFTVGDGVFETLKTVDGRRRSASVPFAMDRHIARLSRSAAGMGMAMPDPDDVRDALLAVCAANPELAGGGRLRITLTSGPGRWARSGAPGHPRSWSPRPRRRAGRRRPRWRCRRGRATSAARWSGLKSTSYAENVLALAHAKSLGAGEALLGNLAGEVCEGTGSNVFVVADGRIITPPLTSGCLAGITRALVIEWCADAGIDDRAAPRSPWPTLADAEEIFITSSTRDVHPVDAVIDDERPADLGGRGRDPDDRARPRSSPRGRAAQWNP